MKERKKLEDLNVLNDFLLNAIATDPDVAKPFFQKVLSILLEREIGEVTVHAQSYLPGTGPENRGVFLDVEIHENGNSPAECRVYNVESQLYKEVFLQRRARFYQAKKDSKNLKRGDTEWNKLPDMYMIIITNYDPFGEDSMIYSFQNVCKEFPELEYNDGLKFIYFNTAGHKNGTNSIKQLLEYLNYSKIENVTNKEIAQIHSYVSDVKQASEVKGRYMTVGEWLDRERLESRAEGLAEGRVVGLAEGRVAGLQDALITILERFGAISEQLQERLRERVKEADAETLNKWIGIAVRADSLEDCLSQMG